MSDKKTRNNRVTLSIPADEQGRIWLTYSSFFTADTVFEPHEVYPFDPDSAPSFTLGEEAEPDNGR